MYRAWVCSRARFANYYLYRARLVLDNLEEERGLVAGLWRKHGPSESTKEKKLLRYGPSVLFEWELKEIYKSKCYQRRDDQIIAHAPNLQEGEHCVSLFMVLTKYFCL